MGSPTKGNYDYFFKILLIGDSGVGKSSVDFKINMLTFGGKRLKLTIWDTAGQERFGTVISSYYRGAHGIILDLCFKEVELYSTNSDCIKILVGNKVDRDSEIGVSKEEGVTLAREHKCSFMECSAKTREHVERCFKEVTSKILEVPSLLENGSVALKQQMLKQKQVDQKPRCCT